MDKPAHRGSEGSGGNMGCNTSRESTFVDAAKMKMRVDKYSSDKHEALKTRIGKLKSVSILCTPWRTVWLLHWHTLNHLSSVRGVAVTVLHWNCHTSRRVCVAGAIADQGGSGVLQQSAQRCLRAGRYEEANLVMTIDVITIE